MKKKLHNAIYWFDMMVHNFGLECETSTFIHNTLSNLLTNTLEDGTMIWDDEMVEKSYPQAVDKIKRKEHEKIFNEFNWLMKDIERRLKDG